MNIEWTRQEKRIWTSIVDIRFDRGLLTSHRPVAIRIAPEDTLGMTGAYRVDRKSMACLPWEAVTAKRFGTKAEAATFAKHYVTEAGAQNTYTPRLAGGAS